MGLAGVENLLEADAGVSRDLGCGGRGAGRPGEPVTYPFDPERELLEITRHVQRPAVVAKMAFDRAGDARHSVGGEGGVARGVEAVDGLDEREARHLLEVLERLGAAPVPTRQAAGEREVALDQELACARIAAALIREEQLLFCFPLYAHCGRPFSSGSTARTRSAP